MTYGGLIASQMNKAEHRASKSKGDRRRLFDHYPTPWPVLRAIAGDFSWAAARSILDIGAGDDGRWGIEFAQYCDRRPTLTGVEIRDVPAPPTFDHWHNIDYTAPIERVLAFGSAKFDLIVANPPFKFANEIVETALKQLSPRGRVLMLLPTDFAHSIARFKGIMTQSPPFRVVHIADRIDFTGDKSPHQYMSLFEWREGHKGANWSGSSWSWANRDRS